MFKFLDLREQLLEERRKNKELRALCKDLEDAAIELAGIIAEYDERLGELEG